MRNFAHRLNNDLAVFNNFVIEKFLNGVDFRKINMIQTSSPNNELCDMKLIGFNSFSFSRF